MRKFTEKIQSKFDPIKDALYHRVVRPLREDIVRRGADTVARGLDLTPREVVRELGIDSHAIAEVMSKADIVECLDMQDIAGYCEVDTRDVAESITDNGFLDYSELSEHLEESEELAQEIAKRLAGEVDLNGLAVALLRRLAADSEEAKSKSKGNAS